MKLLSCCLLAGFFGLLECAAYGSFFDRAVEAVEPSSSTFAHRGFLIDMAGHKERDAYYFDLVDQLALCGFNALYLRLADDDGCAIELQSYPEMSSPRAMPQATLKKLLARAARQGIQVIPVVEIWGRALWILHHHPELMDMNNPVGLKTGLGQAMTIQQEIIEEIAGLFAQSEYLHLGVGAIAPDRGEDETETPRAMANAQRIIEHLNVLCEMVSDQGKIPMFWTEQFGKYPQILPEIEHPVQFMIDLDKEENPDALIEIFQARGYSLIASSPMVTPHSMMFASEGDFKQQRQAARLACEKKMAGLVTAFYKPQRLFPGVLSHALFYSGRLSGDSSPEDEAAIMKDFASSYFGTRDPDVAEAMLELCRIDNRLEAMEATYWRDRESFKDRLTDDAHERDIVFTDRVMAIHAFLERSVGSIGEHEQDYESYRLLGEFLQYLARRRLLPSNVRDKVDLARVDWGLKDRERAIANLEAALESIKALENERVEMIDRLNEHWDGSRYTDSQNVGEVFGEDLMGWVTSDTTNGYGSYELSEALEKLIEQVKEGGELVLTPPDNR